MRAPTRRDVLDSIVVGRGRVSGQRLAQCEISAVMVVVMVMVIWLRWIDSIWRLCYTPNGPVVVVVDAGRTFRSEEVCQDISFSASAFRHELDGYILYSDSARTRTGIVYWYEDCDVLLILLGRWKYGPLQVNNG